MTEVNLSPAVVDLVLYRGDSVDLTFRLGEGDGSDPPVFTTGYNLTGVAFAAQIRATQDSTVILAAFAVTVADQSDPATVGTVTISLETGDTDELPTSAKWDLQATWPGATVRTYLAGKVKTSKDTTRE